MSTTIDLENAKRIRKPMEIYVRVEATIDGDPVVFNFTNKDIISVELNLRSDLSPIDPTLPESEIEVHVYYEDDISDIVKKIADDQPLQYWAGYDGDYSPVRQFYISEPITWSNKELIFKAVDAVHFLDKEVGDIYLGNLKYLTVSDPTLIRNVSVDATNPSNAFRLLTACFVYLVSQGVTLDYVEPFPADNSEGKLSGAYHQSLIGGNIRDIVANMMNLLHQSYNSGFFTFTDFWLNFVDAGIPTVTWSKPSANWIIYEEDCGDIQQHTDRDIVAITAKNRRIMVSSYNDGDLSWGGEQKNCVKVGEADITKDQGATLSLDSITSICAISIEYGQYRVKLALDTLGGPPLNMVALTQDGVTFGFKAFEEDAWEPWNTYLADFWNDAETGGIVQSTDTQASFTAYGNAYQITNDSATYTKTGTGTSVSPNNTLWTGFIDAAKTDDTLVRYRLLPDRGFQSILARSGITGSFTWKGDPRMQPRDVIEWHYKDGTTEERTIESINLKHEAGGTIAEITYRKGNV